MERICTLETFGVGVIRMSDNCYDVRKTVDVFVHMPKADFWIKFNKKIGRSGLVVNTGDRGAWTRAAIANIDDELTVLFCLVQGNPEAFLPRDLRMIKGRDGQESQKAGELLNRLG